MEENISHVIEITFSVFLFVFALTCAVLSYSKMDAVAENMISINLVNRRGTTADTTLESADTYRKTDYGEIALSILNLEKSFLTSNTNYIIEVKTKAGNVIIATYDREVVPDPDGFEPSITGKIILNINGGMIKEEFIVSSTSGQELFKSGAESFLDVAKDYFGVTSKYNISYTESKIIFKEI